MHLLSRTPAGVFSLTEFTNEDNLPPYAVLSHRWTRDEPTLQDVQNAPAPAKLPWHSEGLRKLHFCGKQAAKDGLDYFWVDTVCIDKTNSVALQRAITSMFRWYANSAKCYVYMSDVDEMDKGFGRSAWFTRGWTLQELVAPPVVEFYSRRSTFLGTKSELVRDLSDITKIPVRALEGAPLDEFSVEERMSWAANRTTTEPEDRAYCLLGIFGVFLLANYGEREYAFVRLEDEIERRSAKRSMTTPVATPVHNEEIRPALPPRPVTDVKYPAHPLVANNNYNCFGSLRSIKHSGWGLEDKGLEYKCDKCQFNKHGKTGYQSLTMPDNRTLPEALLTTRFHHRRSLNEVKDFLNPSVLSSWNIWRCFICKNGVEMSWDALRTHLLQNHTFDQICHGS